MQERCLTTSSTAVGAVHLICQVENLQGRAKGCLNLESEPLADCMNLLLTYLVLHLICKDWDLQHRAREVGIQLVQVALPLPLPGQVHQSGPLAPPQLYQTPSLINAGIEAWHLQNTGEVPYGLRDDRQLQLVVLLLLLYADASGWAICISPTQSDLFPHQCLHKPGTCINMINTTRCVANTLKISQATDTSINAVASA